MKKEKPEAIDGDICDSKEEVKVDNFLYRNSIAHFKPKEARKGQYYKGKRYYPDWVVKGSHGTLIIEYLGSKGRKDYHYDEKTREKRNRVKEGYEYLFLEQKDLAYYMKRVMEKCKEIGYFKMEKLDKIEGKMIRKKVGDIEFTKELKDHISIKRGFREVLIHRDYIDKVIETLKELKNIAFKD